MCGIVAVDIKSITPDQIKLVKNVLLESQVRGMHAAGVVWSDGVDLHSKIVAAPMEQLLEDNPTLIEDAVINGNLKMIAHIRYSTSDLMFNQPIMDKGLAIAHNGVITQTDSAHWGGEFDLKVSTRNDSELILRALQNGEDPIEKFPDASIAYVSIDNLGNIEWDRNGKRPLYATLLRNGSITTSTSDIMKRASNDRYKSLPVFPSGEGEDLQ